MNATWNYPTHVRFGAGRIAELADACRAAGMTRPLLVTDPGLARLAMVEDAVARTTAAGLPTAVFSAIKPNPVEANILAGVAAFRDGGHDGVVAMGGGSALDAGKAIAFLAHQARPIWDFEDAGDNWRRADPLAIRPTVAVPTTAGTGSEVGRVSVVTDERLAKKRLIFHPRIMPVAVIEDAELTVGLPPHLTAATGMDALAHCLEAFCAPGYHPIADGVALEGMRLIARWLPVAVREPANLEARGHMLAAATMGATAFQKGLGAIHSLAHPLGVLYDAHHGMLNAVLMPYVLGFNRGAIGERMALLARVLGLARGDTEGVIDWVVSLRRAIGIAHTLPEAGIADAERHEGKIASDAVVDPTAPTNPVPLDAAGARRILAAAIAGTRL